MNGFMQHIRVNFGTECIVLIDVMSHMYELYSNRKDVGLWWYYNIYIDVLRAGC